MPRDGSETRASLLAEAERLFAERGVWVVTNREITEAAGQKNVSALNYHFGSRSQLLAAVLARHGERLEAERGALLAGLADEASTRELVSVLAIVYAGALATVDGRHYVRVVDQLRSGLADWRTGPAAGDVHLQRTLSLLEERPDAKPEVRSQRLVAMMMLMVGMTAARAEVIAAGLEPAMAHEAFVDSLIDILVAVLEG
ncbi:MAG: TetR family transcriptional regulator [Actinomycetota bacterium]